MDSSDLATSSSTCEPSTSPTQSASDFKSTLRTFQRLDQQNASHKQQSTTTAARRRWLGSLGKSADNTVVHSSARGSSSDDLVHVSVLSALPAGSFKINPTTTFSDLRLLIAKQLGHGNFAFQDATTKRPLISEDRPIRSVKTPILIAQCGVDNLLADSTFQDSSNTAMSREQAAFKVFWWDSALSTTRLVWLKFDPQRIIVSSSGGSFKLFDANGLRNPLVFAGVKGSDKGFQFVKGNSRLSSRFFAQSVEQKHLISVYFCFVWRPSAVRRGWLPRLDVDMARLENVFDAVEPRSFVNLLRRHMIEIDRMVQDLERSMDSKLVRHYLSLFSQMFTGGFVMKEGDLAPLSHGELQSFGKVSKLMHDWEESVARQRREKQDTNNNTTVATEVAKAPKKKTAEAIAFEEFFDEVDDPFEIAASLATLGAMKETNDAPVMGEGGIPLPPPPPPLALAPMQQRPAICPVNFEAISASEISGTIWADMSVMNLKQREMERLEKHLRILFGREARDRPATANDSSQDGVLETSRLRNLEVLLFMEELKGLSTSEMIDLILNFDQRIFCPSVLERLVRKISREGDTKSSLGGEGSAKAIGPAYAFLPSQKESDSLLEHEKKHGTEDLRPGELFFLQLTTKVPDRMQRFEFGYFITKMESEMPSIRGSLLTIERAEKAVRGSERFRAALKIVLDVLTTLMPRYGLTRGFRISSFVSNVDRVTGSVQNPDSDEPTESEVGASLEPFLDPSLPEAQRKRLLKLATLRKKNPKANAGANGGGLSESAEFWHVRLPEYLTVFMNRFEVCQGFWNDLLDPCDDAMRVDLAQLELMTGDWMTQLEAMKIWYDENGGGPTLVSNAAGTNGDGKPSRPARRDGFFLTVSKFMSTSAKELLELRAEVLETKALTEALWKWMGEVMGSEPTMIFKYIHSFSESFQKQWKQLESNWNHKRTMVLRGALKMKPPPARKAVDESTSKNAARKKRLAAKKTMGSIGAAISSIESGKAADSANEPLEGDYDDHGDADGMIDSNGRMEHANVGDVEVEESTDVKTDEKVKTTPEPAVSTPPLPTALSKKKQKEEEHRKKKEAKKQEKQERKDEKKKKKMGAPSTATSPSTAATPPQQVPTNLVEKNETQVPPISGKPTVSAANPPSVPPKPTNLQPKRPTAILEPTSRIVNTEKRVSVVESEREKPTASSPQPQSDDVAPYSPQEIYELPPPIPKKPSHLRKKAKQSTGKKAKNIDAATAPKPSQPPTTTP